MCQTLTESLFQDYISNLCGGAIIWGSKKHTSTAVSSTICCTESEYMAFLLAGSSERIHRYPAISLRTRVHRDQQQRHPLRQPSWRYRFGQQAGISLTFDFLRHSMFPLRLAFAITINKLQG